MCKKPINQWLSTFLMLSSLNTIPHVVLTLNYKIISLLLHNCNLVLLWTIMQISGMQNIWYAIPPGGQDSHIENRSSKQACCLYQQTYRQGSISQALVLKYPLFMRSPASAAVKFLVTLMWKMLLEVEMCSVQIPVWSWHPTTAQCGLVWKKGELLMWWVGWDRTAAG